MTNFKSFVENNKTTLFDTYLRSTFEKPDVDLNQIYIVLGEALQQGIDLCDMKLSDFATGSSKSRPRKRSPKGENVLVAARKVLEEANDFMNATQIAEKVGLDKNYVRNKLNEFATSPNTDMVRVYRKEGKGRDTPYFRVAPKTDAPTS